MTVLYHESCSAVGILVDLLTLEVQSYGEECLAGSKVVEHVTSAGVNVVPVSQPTPAAPPPPPAATCPPVRPPPPQPAPPVVTSNTFIRPSKPVFVTPVRIHYTSVFYR